MKDLTKNRWKFVLIPALIVIAGIVLYIVHGGFNFDVEFMGGIRMQVNMHTDFDNKEVADLIQEKTVDTVSAKVQTGDNPQVAVIKTPPVDETVKTEIFAVSPSRLAAWSVSNTEGISTVIFPPSP